MSIAEIRQEIAQLSNAERIELSMWLWESIDENEIESPAWHAQVLAQREAEIESGTAKFLTLNAVRKRFEN